MFYVYRFFDKYDSLIYVGRTTDLDKRIEKHFKDKNTQEYSWKQEIHRIDYTGFDSHVDAVLAEIYYISRFNPIYNTEYKNLGNSKLINTPFVFKKYQKKHELKNVTVEVLQDFYNYYKHRKNNREELFTPKEYVEYSKIVNMDFWKNTFKLVLINDLKCVTNVKNYNYVFIDNAMEKVKNFYNLK